MTAFHFHLAPSIQRLLRQVRRLVRVYVSLEGTAAILLTLGVLFWLTLGIDWLFEPPSGVRRALLAAAAMAVLAMLDRLVARRVLARLTPASLALLVERRHRGFADSLITAVELSATPATAAAPCDRVLLEATHQSAAARAANLDARSLFDWRPLRRAVALAAAAVLSVALFAGFSPAAFGVWQRRTLLLSDELWPRFTQLSVEGFEQTDTVKVALGSDLPLVVRAAAGPENRIPSTVELRTVEPLPRREAMSREGQAIAGVDAYQRFTHSLKAIFSSFDLYVVGGDARLGPLHIVAVESPSLGDVTLGCIYPPYTGIENRELPLAGLMQFPVGSQLTLRARANKPLRQMQVETLTAGQKPAPRLLEFGDEGQRGVELDLPPVDQDQTLQLTLWDTDGIHSREPLRITLAALADEPPQIAVSAQGIGRSVTPQARLPIRGTAQDDYGLAKAWLELTIDETPPQVVPLTLADPGAREITVEQVVDVSNWQLHAGQKLQWLFRAADGCNLSEGPHIGNSPRFLLELVTPEQLLVLLQSRELTLRRRFETMIQDLTDTRDLLVRITLPAEPAGPNAAALDSGPPRLAADAQASRSLAAQATDRPAEPPRGSPAPPAALEPAEAAARRSVQVERVAQNLARTQQELGETSDAFAGIFAELVNNRMDNEDHRSRIVDGIVAPLSATRENSLPLAQSRVQSLRSHLEDPVQSGPARQAALVQMDRVLGEMNIVLKNMIQLETLNEMVALLRDILENQEQITAKTKAQQRRRLLEDD